MKQRIHFITYGDSPKYSISKKHILGLAKHSGFFESCSGYSKKDLDYEFINKYNDILNEERGGGYYLWKPRIIYNVLKNIKPDDVLVYTDSGSTFNYHAKNRFYDYIELLISSEFANLRFENKKQYIEKYWTSKELFEYFNVDIDSNNAESVQLMGGHLLFQNNEHTKNLLEEFFEVVNYDRKLITDFYTENSIKGFQENRHDQSILSLLTKTLGGVILENETFFDKGSETQKNYPFLSVRNYGHGKRDRIKFLINFKEIKKNPIYF